MNDVLGNEINIDDVVVFVANSVRNPFSGMAIEVGVVTKMYSETVELLGSSLGLTSEFSYKCYSTPQLLMVIHDQRILQHEKIQKLYQKAKDEHPSRTD